ncbi:DUF485 domain-containing protein [Streptomyces sp. ME02-8801-2C]|uniref:DUF485 domain-containing protein n=1 Tax=Streptomyces sp. ME02-8801-2C TaxID=3028680 RepID=UPI0029B925AB|nr:DUF485 domain-containing protein [Streptomyces sp. ME02-8801-2C]MDX3456536.1 DUF485 domain-containing protein [Streptomyces sp. ME02-8801-2C]
MSNYFMRPEEPPAYSRTYPEPAPERTIHGHPEFQSLRNGYRRFAALSTALAVGGFLLYVLLSNFAPGIMNQPLAGHMTLGLTLGLGQFAVMAVTAWRYVRRMRTSFDPVAQGLRAHLDERRSGQHGPAERDGVRPQSTRGFRTW